MSDIDPYTRPFSPSPPRENRHTASRPPSLLLAASFAGTLAPSSQIDLAGLPATPPHSQHHPYSDVVNYFDGDPQGPEHIRSYSTPSHHTQPRKEKEPRTSIASGEFARGRTASLKSGKHRRNSDSSTSSSSPPLGATSLLASLADPAPQVQQGFSTPKRDTPEVAIGTPDSSRSIDSTLSATSHLFSTSKSFPRLHQPTVVRSSSGRGLAFLPPPAQISPSNSSFSIHQPLDERHRSGSTRNRAGSHSTTMSDDLHSLSLDGGYGHTRATSLTSTGQTVVQRLTSLAETFPERPASRITNASSLAQDGEGSSDLTPYHEATNIDNEPKTLKPQSIVVLPRPDISSQSASVHSFNVEDDNKSDSEISLGRTSPEHKSLDPNPTLPDYVPETLHSQAPTTSAQLETGTRDLAEDDLSKDDQATDDSMSSSLGVAAMAMPESHEPTRFHNERAFESDPDFRQKDLELEPESIPVPASLDTESAIKPSSSDVGRGDDIEVLGTTGHEKSLNVPDSGTESLEKSLTPVEKENGTDEEYFEENRGLQADERGKETEQIQAEMAEMALHSMKLKSTNPQNDQSLMNENSIQPGPQEVQKEQDQSMASDHESEVESESSQAKNTPNGDFAERVLSEPEKANQITNNDLSSANSEKSEKGTRTRFESLEAIGPEDSELDEQLHEVEPIRYAYDKTHLGPVLSHVSIKNQPSLTIENEKGIGKQTESTGNSDDLKTLPYTPRKGAKCFPATTTTIHSEANQNTQLPFAISLYTTLSTSQPLPQLATQRVELSLAWLDSTQNSLLRYIPGSRLIPSWNVKYVTGSKDYPVVFDPRSFVKNVIERIPVVRRFSSWL